MSFKACPSRSPPNSIITLKNFTAHWECKQPGPGLDRTSLHFLETVMHNNEYTYIHIYCSCLHSYKYKVMENTQLLVLAQYNNIE